VSEYCIFRFGESKKRIEQWKQLRKKYRISDAPPIKLTSTVWIGRAYDVTRDRFAFVLMVCGDIKLQWPAKSLREFFNLKAA
jgi:hypothetical protein